MQKKILSSLIGLSLLIITSFSVAENKNYNTPLAYILEDIQKINDYIYNHPLTTKQLVADPEFAKIVANLSTKDSYACLFDKDLTTYIHPDKSLLGKKLTTIPEAKDTIKIIQDAVKNNTCKRGFYTLWLDKQEKYMIACPISVLTKNGDKLLYVYTIYTRSMPDYQLKTIQNDKKNMMD